MPYDNSVCESFFSPLKREELYRTNYTSENHLRKSLAKYAEFYNNKRPHGYLCNRTPSKTEDEFYQYLSQKENNSNRT